MAELLTDGAMETWTDTKKLTNWIETGTAAARQLDRVGSFVQQGTYAAKLTATANDGSTDFGIYQTINVGTGQHHVLTGHVMFYNRDTGKARCDVYDETNSLTVGKLELVQSSGTGTYYPIKLDVVTGTGASHSIRIYLDDSTNDVIHVDNFSFQISPSYTSVAKVRGRLEQIDSSLTDVQIGYFIDHAEGIIDSICKTSWTGTVPGLVEAIATDIAAYYALLFNPAGLSNSSEAALLADMLWANIERGISLISDERILKYLESL